MLLLPTSHTSQPHVPWKTESRVKALGPTECPGKISLYTVTTPCKFNSSPLKIGKRKRLVFQPSFSRGVGCIYIYLFIYISVDIRLVECLCPAEKNHGFHTATCQFCSIPVPKSLVTSSSISQAHSCQEGNQPLLSTPTDTSSAARCHSVASQRSSLHQNTTLW